MTEVHRFAEPTAHHFASRKAKYGHRHWIAWHLPDGTHAAARLAEDTLRIAIDEAMSKEYRTRKRSHVSKAVFVIDPGGTSMMMGDGGLGVLMRNIQAGHHPDHQ